MKYEFNHLGTIVWIFLVGLSVIALGIAQEAIVPVASAELTLATVNGGKASYAAQRLWTASYGMGGFLVFLFAAVSFWPLCISKTKNT